MKIIHYGSSKKSNSIKRIIKEMISEWKESNELGIRLFKRNIKALYRQSVLGITWAIIPPLMTAALWIVLRSNNVISMGDTGISYPVYVITGTMMWKMFSESIQLPLKNITKSKSIIVKINIPKNGLILSSLYEIIFNTVIKLLLIIILLLYFGQQFNWQFLFFPIGILGIIIVGFSLGVLLIPIGLLYKDIEQGLMILLPFLMYLTPVVYPKPDEGIMGFIMNINPMATIIPVTRNWFTGQQVEQLNQFWFFLGIFIILAFIAIIIYRISLSLIIERIGN